MAIKMNTSEIHKFSAQKQDWWDKDGGYASLHKINAARLEYIHNAIRKPINECSVLDVGAGGGLVSEPLAKLGAKVTGIDASEQVIKTAKKHAKKLPIKYECISIENFSSKDKFDVILLLDILEHTDNIEIIFKNIKKLLKKDGIVIISTLNRTVQSLLFGVIAAEHILNWVPKGMHDWNKFIKPSELKSVLNKNGFSISDISGITYNPIRDKFYLNKDNLNINYILTCSKND